MSSHPYFDTDGAIVALAHRGFSREGLENSMAAFQAAVDLGYRYVETDAHGTVDGVAVALHDASLDRTTDGAGKVSELPVKRVTAALIGGKEPVPTLEELLGTWPQLRVNIDVKAESGIVPIAEAIERTKSHDRVCLASFSTARRRATAARLSRPVATSAGTRETAAFALGNAARAKVAGALRAVATSAGTRETAAFALGNAARAKVAGALRAVDALQVPVTAGPLRLVTAKSVRVAHSAGKHVHVWTINDPEQMNALVDLGVDGIVTDRADLLKEVLITRGRWE